MVRIEYSIEGDYVKPVINGIIDYRGIHVSSTPSLLGDLSEMLSQVYRRAYEQGVQDQQDTVKKALGL